MTPEPTAPFGNIALCLSGGGYRAAAFALGTIDMLDELDLLKDVKLFSTVSGGTFTGVTYAAWLSEGKSYGTFYGDFYKFLLTTNCVDQALNDLYRTPSPSGSNDLSLIRSAAKVYNDTLFKGRKFAPLTGLVGDDKRFLELIFNSTEFLRGNSFRFRASHNPRVYAGNGNFKVVGEIAEEILLADIVAASSCFPAAFEPLRFPEDFYWQSGLDAVRQRLIQNTGQWPSGFKGPNGKCISVPLMDGGIYDNQGISNAVMADRTTDDPEKTIFGLFLISDTSARDNDMLRYPKPDTKDGWLTIYMLFLGAVLLYLVSAVSAGVLIYALAAGIEDGLTLFRIIFQYAAPIGLFLTLMGILGWAYRLFSKNKEIVVSGAKFPLWKWVKRLTMPDFINMAKARFTSLGTMSGDVFMKRVRQLEFNNIMSDPVRDKRVSFDLIYDMNPTEAPDFWKQDPSLKPTEEMKKISEAAEAVKTTLWFEGDKDLKLLIVCGQCTTIYSLLKYLWKSWYLEQAESPVPIPKPNESSSPWHNTYEFLHKKWEEMKTDPYSLLDRKRA